MDIRKARKLARELRDHHGLDDWSIKFKTKMRYSGVIATTYYDSKEFHFSSQNFILNSEEFCRDQILHEIAHALVDWEDGHGEPWKKKCVEIGAIPFQVSEEAYA